MRRLYLVLACLILLLGLVHVSATFALFDALTSRAVWFAGGGMAIIFTGVLNLLNRAYGAAAPGVRWAAIGANAADDVGHDLDVALYGGCPVPHGGHHRA